MIPGVHEKVSCATCGIHPKHMPRQVNLSPENTRGHMVHIRVSLSHFYMSRFCCVTKTFKSPDVVTVSWFCHVHLHILYWRDIFLVLEREEQMGLSWLQAGHPWHFREHPLSSLIFSDPYIKYSSLFCLWRICLDNRNWLFSGFDVSHLDVYSSSHVWCNFLFWLRPHVPVLFFSYEQLTCLCMCWGSRHIWNRIHSRFANTWSNHFLIVIDKHMKN